MSGFSISAIAKSAWHDLRRGWGTLVVFEIAFKLAEAWLLVPLVAVGLSAVLSQAGKVAVSNRDIVDFLQTPTGMVYVSLLVIGAVALLLFEQAGIMVLAAQMHRNVRSIKQLVAAIVIKAWKVVQLGAMQAAIIALALAPFVALAFIVYRAMLTEHDIYFYWTKRTAEFWQAVGIGVLIAVAAAAVAAWLYIRWCLALPILLFEAQPPRASMQASAARVRGAVWRIAFMLLGWQALVWLAGVVMLASFRLLAAFVLERAGERPTITIAILLAVQGGLVAAVSFVAIVGQALLTRRIYLQRSEQLGATSGHEADIEKELATAQAAAASPWPRRFVYACLAGALISPVVIWVDAIRRLPEHSGLKVTAHRGFASRAPENTMAAVSKAIESGADYAEIDLQQTADGVIVVLHDSDLKRIARVPRRLADMTFDELRQLDVGSWFAPEFASERVPTLDEVIDLARGRIKLNLELKYYGPDQGLAGAVAHKLTEKKFEDECVITSFDARALGIVQQANPKLRTGLIVAQALGDVSRLDVPILSVRADWLTDAVLKNAHRHEQEVHVWTVNDPRQVTELIKRGVDNVITDDPPAVIRVRDAWSDMTPAERLVLASRIFLGLDL